MTAEEIIADIEALIAKYRKPAEPPKPLSLRLPSGSDLASALLTEAATIELESGGVYGALKVTRAVTIIGNGASLHNPTGPALHVLPGVSGVLVSDVSCTSGGSGAVVQLGNNDETQTTIASIPRDIRLERVIVPTHRGKRGFEINSADTVLRDCQARDVYTTTTQDSSALGILNTTGNVTVLGGVYEGGSECLLVGGDTLKLAGVTAPAALLFDGVLFTRPVSWKTDGVSRVVKNIFELKTGHHVMVRKCVLEHCWRDGQDGYGVMLTPTRGGSLVDIVFEACVISDVGGGVNISGLDASGISKVRTTGLVLRECVLTISKAINGGTGWPFLLTNGPGTLDVERCTIKHDGNALLFQSGPGVDRIRITASTVTAGKYGLNIAGGANGSNWKAGVAELAFTGNTISGAANVLKTAFPDNTYSA